MGSKCPSLPFPVHCGRQVTKKGFCDGVHNTGNEPMKTTLLEFKKIQEKNIYIAYFKT